MIFIPLIIALIAGFLAAFAGSDHTPKALRRIVVPVIVTVYAFVLAIIHIGFLLCLWTLTCFSIFISYALGHGTPSPDDEKPSTLGKFWSKFTDNERTLNVLIRGTKAVIVSISLLSVPILTGKWILYALGVVGVLATYIISWGLIKGIKSIKFSKYEIVPNDIIGYTLSLTIITYFIWFSFL